MYFYARVRDRRRGRGVDGRAALRLFAVHERARGRALQPHAGRAAADLRLPDVPDLSRSRAGAGVRGGRDGGVGVSLRRLLRRLLPAVAGFMAGYTLLQRRDAAGEVQTRLAARARRSRDRLSGRAHRRHHAARRRAGRRLRHPRQLHAAVHAGADVDAAWLASACGWRSPSARGCAARCPLLAHAPTAAVGCSCAWRFCRRCCPRRPRASASAAGSARRSGGGAARPGVDLLAYLRCRIRCTRCSASLSFGWLSALPGGFNENVASVPWVAIVTIVGAVLWAGFRPLKGWVVFTGVFACLALGPFITDRAAAHLHADALGAAALSADHRRRAHADAADDCS